MFGMVDFQWRTVSFVEGNEITNSATHPQETPPGTLDLGITPKGVFQ